MKLPLSLLDEYAKSLTANQIKRLVENKLSKLDEEEQKMEIYMVCLSLYNVITATGKPIFEFVYEFNEKCGAKLNKVTCTYDEDFVKYTAENEADYKQLYDYLIMFSFAPDVIKKATIKKEVIKNN